MERENENQIGVLIEKILSSSGLQYRLDLLDLFQAWNDNVGNDVAQSTTNKFFKDGILFCTISSSLVRNRLYFQLDNIKNSMNKQLGSDKIKKIVLK
jgi:hypothetical protein